MICNQRLFVKTVPTRARIYEIKMNRDMQPPYTRHDSEEMYDINQSDVDVFIQKELLDHQYEVNRVLGERYINLKDEQ